MKLLGFVLMVIAVCALIAGLALGGTELLNPRRTRIEIEQIALENERVRTELAHQENLRQIELEKQRQLAQREVEAYPQILQRRQEAIEVVIMAIGVALAAAILAVSAIIVYYIYKRATQFDATGRTPRPASSVVPDRHHLQVHKNGDLVYAERAA
jgi:hypothetical protein